jgi:hypothetical protein
LGEWEIDVVRTKQISVDSLISRLKQDQQDKDTKTKRKIMQYGRRRIHDVYVWLPAGVSVNMSQYVSQLENKATKINQINNIFKYKTCRLSRQSMQMIAGFSMHHSGGLDQALSLTLTVAW